MQFGSYIFEHNPKNIQIAYRTNLVKQYLPFVGEQNKSLGRRLKEITCKGTFFSSSPSDSQKQCETLMDAASSYKSQILMLPGLEPFAAFLDSIAFELCEDGKAIPYTIRFIEAGGNT